MRGRINYGAPLFIASIEADQRDAAIMWSLGDALQVEGANPAVFGKYRGLSIAHSLVATVLEIGPVLLRKVNIVYFA